MARPPQAQQHFCPRCRAPIQIGQAKCSKCQLPLDAASLQAFHAHQSRQVPPQRAQPIRTRPPIWAIAGVGVVGVCILSLIAAALTPRGAAVTPTAGLAAAPTFTSAPLATDTAEPATETTLPPAPTDTSAPPTDTAVPPTATAIPPTPSPTVDAYATEQVQRAARVEATRTAVVKAIGLPYDPFGDDRNCKDFTKQRQAQLFMEASGEGDPHNLDGNPKDGKACETLP